MQTNENSMRSDCQRFKNVFPTPNPTIQINFHLA